MLTFLLKNESARFCIRNETLWTVNITEETTCQDCGKVFSDESGFKRHFRQYHKKKESDCHICERKFYTEFLLKNHIGLRHTSVNCDICDTNLL